RRHCQLLRCRLLSALAIWPAEFRTNHNSLPKGDKKAMTKLNVGDPVKVTVQKYDPSCDEAPYFRTYTVPYTREMRILEALDYIVEEIGDSLAYQWFCGVKKCGMCGFLVNGQQKLGC